MGGISKWKKALGKMQTLSAGCSKAEPEIFAPPQTPFPGAEDGQNLISWRWSLPSPIDPVWWRSMHPISSYRGNRSTKPQTHNARPLQTGPITIHCTTKLSVQCKDLRNESDALFTVNQCVQYQSIISHDLRQTKAHSTITETEIGSHVLFVYDSRWTEEQHIVARS